MRRSCLLFAGGVLAAGLFVKPLFAADSPDGARTAAATAAPPNAAVIYWHAFATMPVLGDDQKQKLEAATKAATPPVADDLRPTLALFDSSLRALERARKVPFCDWQIDYDE